MADMNATERRLADSAEKAVALGLPPDLAKQARRAALGRAASSTETWSPARLDAYFWGIVRRSAMRGGAKTRAIRERYLEASVIQDMRRSGYGSEAA